MEMLFIAARKRSLGQGNIFIGMCQEFCSQWGCLLPRGVSAHGGLLQGMSAPGGGGSAPGDTAAGGTHPTGMHTCF